MSRELREILSGIDATIRERMGEAWDKPGEANKVAQVSGELRAHLSGAIEILDELGIETIQKESANGSHPPEGELQGTIPDTTNDHLPPPLPDPTGTLIPAASSDGLNGDSPIDTIDPAEADTGNDDQPSANHSEKIESGERKRKVYATFFTLNEDKTDYLYPTPEAMVDAGFSDKTRFFSAEEKSVRMKYFVGQFNAYVRPLIWAIQRPADRRPIYQEGLLKRVMRLLEAEGEYPPDLSEEDIIPIIRREITFADLRKKYTKPDTSASPEVVPPISGISNSGTIVDSSEIARISSQVAVQTPTQMPRSPRSSEDNASFLDHILTSSPPRVPFAPPPTPRPIVRTLPRPATVRIDTSASVRRTEPKKPNTQRIPSPKIGGNKDNNVNRVEQDGSFSSYFFTLEETLVMADVLIRLNVQSPIDAKRVGVEIDMEQLKNLRLNVALLWKRFPRKLSDFLQARGPLWRKLGEIASQPERERIKGKPSDTETYLLMRLSGLSRTQIELLKKAVLDWGSRK